MVDDEEKKLRLELLAADLRLRRKQEFWETPRNIAILVGVTAAIAAGLGFWLGRQSPAPPPAPTIGPAASMIFGGMRPDQFVDSVQTAGIVVIAAMLVYVVIRLDRALTQAAEKLKGALGAQRALPTVELRTMLDKIHRRLDQLEAKNESSSLDH
jgi:hypothetical protein